MASADPASPEQSPPRASRPRSNLLPLLPLGFVIVLGAFLRFHQLGAYSIGNAYYAAAVKSMLTSWDNFFFVAFEPGGSVTVDKPPLGLWIQALSAFILGFNSFALALPQALAGVFSIPLLYHLVRRHFSALAGLTAALLLAAAPITVATERNNTMDGLLVFVLLLAAWAFLKAAETGRVRTLLLGAFLVGVGFNIKMLQAVMPLPAFYAVYLLGDKHSFWKRLLHLGFSTLVFLGIALAWVVVVDLTPADQRPFIGSSTDNTMLELVIGHNGLRRLGLAEERYAGLGGQPGFNPPGKTPPPDRIPPGQLADGPRAGNPPNRPGGGRASETGTAGLLRLFQDPLATEISWLLPLALLGIPLGLAALGWRWPLEPSHLGLLLWSGWLLPCLLYFSFTTGLFHRYYLIMIGPPLSALVGVAIWAVKDFWRRRSRWGWTLLLVLSGFSLGFELFLLRGFPYLFFPISLITLTSWLAGMVLLAVWPQTAQTRWVGSLLVGIALLAAPFLWSLLTALNPTPNTALPTAGPAGNDGTRPTRMTPDQEYLTEYGKAVLDYTASRIEPEEYLLATSHARGAAPFILETGRPVLTFGGFTGNDQVVDLETFQELVDSGQLRFVLGLPQGKPGLSQHIRSTCEAVRLPDLQTQHQQMEVLFDCES